MTSHNGNSAEDGATAPQAQPKPNYRGFLQIFSAPGQLGRQPIQRGGAIVATGLLLYVLCFTLSQVIATSSPAVVEANARQMFESLEKARADSLITDEDYSVNRESMEAYFADPITPGYITQQVTTGFVGGLFYILLIGGILWLFVRLLTESPPSFIDVAALAGYGVAIGGLGMIVTGLMQATGGSLLYSPSPALLYTGETDQLDVLTVILMNANVFDIWKYLAVGVAAAAAAGMNSSRGILFGLMTFIIMFAFVSVTTVLNFMAMNLM